MPARLTAHVPEHPATVRLLAEGRPLAIGRDPECGLPIAHPSVSRAHATLEPDADGWELTDAGSKNGSYVDGQRVDRWRLQHDCWLRFGDVYCEFERLDEAQAEAFETRSRERRHSSALLLRQASAQPDFDAMLRETLRAAVELAGCERGFLLLGDPPGLAVRAAIGLDAAGLSATAFSGSRGAVQRAMDTRRPVVACDVGVQPWLGGRASVVEGGIRALACAPMLGLQRSDGAPPAVVGAVYADRTSGTARISDLDMELFTAFVERMSLAIAARRAGEDLGVLSADALRWERLPLPAGAEA